MCGLRDLRGLDADGLQLPERLPHGLNLFVVGLPLALHLLEQALERERVRRIAAIFEAA